MYEIVFDASCREWSIAKRAPHASDSPRRRNDSQRAFKLLSAVEVDVGRDGDMKEVHLWSEH